MADPKLVQARLKEVLARSAAILFPNREADIQRKLTPHRWRDVEHVGATDGRVVAWEGHKINLAYLDARYRGLYGDLVQNLLPQEERLRLFGEDFARAVEGWPAFVVLFNLNYPPDALGELLKRGFTPRQMNQRTFHACQLYTPEAFLAAPLDSIVCRVIELVLLQRHLAVQRIPLDADEVPFQHFLYHCNYLHGLLVKGGLWVKAITPPRKAGEFGHDMEATVVSAQDQRHLTIGIEVFLKGWGYHVQTVADYVRRLSLDALTVISKDVQDSVLEALRQDAKIPVKRVTTVADLASTREGFPLYHLPLGDVIHDLEEMGNQLDVLLQQTRSVDLAQRDSTIDEGPQ